jgi:hypothetical protein
MATKLKDKIDHAMLYDQDFYAWAMKQAATLRQLKASGRSLPLDFEHLIEEVENLARSELRAARSQVRRLLHHLLKLEYSPAQPPRRQWLNTVDDARAELEDTLSTTIRSKLASDLAACYAKVRTTACRDLSEKDGPEAAASLPESCPYTLDQLLDETWRPTNRHGHVDEPF